jgi:hypothetical protein
MYVQVVPDQKVYFQYFMHSIHYFFQTKYKMFSLKKVFASACDHDSAELVSIMI